jgi:hypothetical protein
MGMGICYCVRIADMCFAFRNIQTFLWREEMSSTTVVIYLSSYIFLTIGTTLGIFFFIILLSVIGFILWIIFKRKSTPKKFIYQKIQEYIVKNEDLIPRCLMKDDMANRLADMAKQRDDYWATEIEAKEQGWKLNYEIKENGWSAYIEQTERNMKDALAEKTRVGKVYYQMWEWMQSIFRCMADSHLISTEMSNVSSEQSGRLGIVLKNLKDIQDEMMKRAPEHKEVLQIKETPQISGQQ